MELPPHHHWTRWWLRRFYAQAGIPRQGRRPNKVVVFDRALQQDVGAWMPYPSELEGAVQQLRALRQRDAEPNDQFIFCDGHGNL